MVKFHIGVAVLELNKIGKAGFLAASSPTVEEITGRKPVAFRRFAEANKEIFQ